MITLKKSFEYQNYLNSLFAETRSVLTSTDIFTITRNHMKSKAYSAAVDEELVAPKRYDLPCSISELVEFACYIQNEIAALTTSINTAKRDSNIDFDGTISINRHKRDLLSALSSMARTKTKENTVTGVAQRFNAEGNPVNYTYEICETTAIDFDRTRVQKLISSLRAEIEDNSTTIDLMQLETKVYYESIFDIGDSLEDAILKWIDVTNVDKD